MLRHMVKLLLEEGYAGLLLILDEVSLYMKDRTDSQRAEDEKALVVLSNRLAKMDNLPVWTVCAAQQAIESTMAGVMNIIARERLDLVPLLNQKDNYYDIALARVREVTEPGAIGQYYEDYKRAFSWPSATGSDQFKRFFPFYPPSVDVLRAVSYNLTTIRSALYFMLQTLKTQSKRKSTEMVTLWALFDDVVNYEEDPSGTTRASPVSAPSSRMSGALLTWLASRSTPPPKATSKFIAAAAKRSSRHCSCIMLPIWPPMA